MLGAAVIRSSCTSRRMLPTKFIIPIFTVGHAMPIVRTTPEFRLFKILILHRTVTNRNQRLFTKN